MLLPEGRSADYHLANEYQAEVAVTMNKILLVDDDVELAEMMSDYLVAEGFQVESVHDGESGLVKALSGEFSLAVLDIMMPRMSGVEVLMRIRQQSRLPVLMLTARGDDTDRILGLEQGADDYVPKPCTARELTARIRAILRRVGGQNEPAAQTLTVGNLVMRPAQRLATWQGQALELTSSEYSLLQVLARNAGSTVSKNSLSEQGLGRPLAKFDHNIEVHLSRIREKLGQLSDGRSVIQTIFRQGYMLIKE